jgi:hypothetical protein
MCRSSQNAAAVQQEGRGARLLLFHGLQQARVRQELLLQQAHVVRRKRRLFRVQLEQLLKITVGLEQVRGMVDALGVRRLAVDDVLDEGRRVDTVAGAVQGVGLEDGEEGVARVLCQALVARLLRTL